MRYLLLSACLAIVACKSRPSVPVAPDAAPATLPDPAAGVGVIEGTVSVGDGWRLPPAPNMASDPFCARQPAPVPAVIAEEDGRLTNVVVSVSDWKSAPYERPPFHQELVLVVSQEGCAYRPRISASHPMKLIVENGDATLHNVHGYRDGRSWFNIAQPTSGMSDEREIRQGGIVKLSCDVHPWMAAYVHVFDHPYFTVSGKGKFRILNVPAGDRKLTFWHEVFGQKTVTVTVVRDAPSVVMFEFSPQD